MIPVRLTLKNFMSYGDEAAVLAFDGLHVASICGDNGNGKSAILEAITWAVWGKTRASGTRASTEDDLIRKGAAEAEVTFDFSLGDQTFRIVKKRRRDKPTSTVLSQDRGEGVFALVSGGGKREVQQQIIDLLNMTHETFLNSAYLQQGRADEFTRQTADKRKQILAEILDLDRYDRLEARAKEIAKERKDAFADFEGELKILEASVNRLPGYREELALLQPLLRENGTELAKQESELNARQERLKNLEVAASQLESAKTQVVRTQNEIVTLKSGLEERQARLSEASKLLTQREAILTDFKALVDSRTRREELEPKIELLIAQETESKELLSEIAIAGERLKSDIRLAESDLKQIELRSSQFEKCQRQIQELTQKTVLLSKTEEKLTQAKVASEAKQTQFEELKVKNKGLTDTLKDLDELLPFLESEDGACPLCTSDLSGGKREIVLQKQYEKKNRLELELKALKQEGTRLSAEKRETASAVENCENELNEIRLAQSQILGLREQLDTLKNQEIDPTEKRKSLADFKRQLEAESFAAPKRIKLRGLQSDLKEGESLRREFESVQARIRTLSDVERRRQELLATEKNIPGFQEDVRTQQASLNSKLEDLSSQELAIEGLKVRASGFEEAKRSVLESDSVLKNLRAEKETFRVREGSFKQYIQGAEADGVQFATKKALAKTLEQDIWLHNRLASAFSRKGVQALIIDNSLPSLESEANELLGKMTDNSMQVKFQTTRKNRSNNDEIETLDIQITDEQGTRPYELFSGGEAFRVNFAIRIALSRMLARRSGAKLETLIMDEGFGTQDGKGREKLVEAIETIKADFKKILVITHMEDLKDAFTQRIEVTKDSKGSRIYVI